MSVVLFSQNDNNSRTLILQDFESGNIELTSYENEDLQPEAWAIDSLITNNNSNYSLKLFGNTWKVAEIEPETVNDGDVWEISAYFDGISEINGIGFMDENNQLFYSLDGTQMLNIEEWITTYQGAFGMEMWNNFQFPLADDWLAWFEYLPIIDKIVFINDNDSGDSGIVYFDDLLNITTLLPIEPEVNISYTIGEIQRDFLGNRSVDVEFSCEIIDPDSEVHTYLWDFGDGNSSIIENPFHTFTVLDNHPYTVLLQVEDETFQTGQAITSIDVDPGPTSFPIKMNFVGDIMLARHYEEAGGIIPTQGVEAIFEPTLEILSENADITIANLECPLTNQGTPHPTKSIVFRGSPDNVNGLIYAGIDVVSLANNHTIDYGEAGLIQTQEVLTEAGIFFSGAGLNSYYAYEPTFYSHSGKTFAFLASCDRTGQYNNAQPYLNAGYNKAGFAYMTPYYISEQLEDVENVADYKILELHAGSEYSLAPGSNYDLADIIDIYDDVKEDEGYNPLLDIPQMWDFEIRHFAIDAGADLVIVHHPHIIQGYEIYNGKLIVHSLGNFIFDLSYPETMPTMILQTEIDESGFTKYSFNPVFIDDYIPTPAIGNLGLHILDYIARRSKDMNTYIYVDRENLCGNIIIDSLSMDISQRNYSIETDFIEDNGMFISPPLHFPKAGNISEITSISVGTDFDYRVGREIVWFGNMENEGCTLWNDNSNWEWFDETEFLLGERSLCHQRNSGASNVITNFEKRIKFYPTINDYTLHGYMKTNNGADVTIQIRYYQSRTSGTSLGTETVGVNLSGDHEWEFYSNKLNPPTNTKYFDIRVNSDGPNSGTAFSWFDEVGVIEWSDWESFSENQSIINPYDYYYHQYRTNGTIASAEINFIETSYGDFGENSFYTDFLADSYSGEIPLEVNFEDLTTINYGQITQWFWDFGDGILSNEENPSHIYTSTGNYFVSLKTKDIYGNTHSKISDTPISVTSGNLLYGDVDLNGEVQAFDASLTLQASVGLVFLSPSQEILADVDGNGEIQAFDASLILQYVVGLITEFPIEQSDINLVRSNNLKDKYVNRENFSIKMRIENDEIILSGGGNISGMNINIDESLIIEKIKTNLLYAWNKNKIAIASDENFEGEFLRIKAHRTGKKSIQQANVSLILNTTKLSQKLDISEISFIDDLPIPEILVAPNPFNPETKISFNLLKPTQVESKIYNIKGELVKTFIKKELQEGEFSKIWKGNNDRMIKISSGIYFIRIKFDNEIRTKKILMLK